MLEFKSTKLFQWKKEHDIKVDIGRTSIEPEPIMRFENIPNVPQQVLDRLAKDGITEPSPIQSLGIPAGLQGQNVIGISRTASGKTLAFLLPAIQHVMRQERRSGPAVLVMLPTRELAEQVEEVCRRYLRSVGLDSVCLVGGMPKGPQMNQLRQGVDIVIATPGRLNDLIQMGACNVSKVSSPIEFLSF